MKNARGQAAHMLGQMRGFRIDWRFSTDVFKRYPAKICEHWTSLQMDPASRRCAFEVWRTRHRAAVARMRQLP